MGLLISALTVVGPQAWRHAGFNSRIGEHLSVGGADWLRLWTLGPQGLAQEIVTVAASPGALTQAACDCSTSIVFRASKQEKETSSSGSS